eukprot:Skav210532  [mRNA]  locus=scaffold3045:288581:289890:+ [translate_table: standard]
MKSTHQWQRRGHKSPAPRRVPEVESSKAPNPTSQRAGGSPSPSNVAVTLSLGSSARLAAPRESRCDVDRILPTVLGRRPLCCEGTLDCCLALTVPLPK